MVSDDDEDVNVIFSNACLSVVHFDDDTLAHVLPEDVWLTLRNVAYGSQLSDDEPPVTLFV